MCKAIFTIGIKFLVTAFTEDYTRGGREGQVSHELFLKIFKNNIK